MNSFRLCRPMWAMGLLLALLLAGCARIPALEIVNDSSDDTICAIYTALPEDEYWSGNHLDGFFGLNDIAPGETVSLDLTPGVYDIRMENCAYDLLLVERQLDIQTLSAPYRLQVTQVGTVTQSGRWYGDEPQEATLRITNAHPADEICYVYFRPAGSGEWGLNRLGVEQTIAPSESRDFRVPEQAYDIALDKCDMAVLAERYDVFVAGIYEVRYDDFE